MILEKEVPLFFKKTEKTAFSLHELLNDDVPYRIHLMRVPGVFSHLCNPG